MSTFTLAVEFPEELRHLGYTEAEIREQVPVLLVLKRKREGVISSPKGQVFWRSHVVSFSIYSAKKASRCTTRPNENWTMS